jgi:hypothetical protein
MRHRLTKPALALLLTCPFIVPALSPAPAQDVLGNIDLSGTNDVNIDRFGNPVFGLRAQREPELRRLRMQAGRPVLQGRVDIFDMTGEDVEAALNSSSLARKMPKVSCDEVDGEVICVAK